MKSLLIEAGHSDSSIISRRGHCNTTKPPRYHNLRWAEGLRQHQSLLKTNLESENEPASKPTKLTKTGRTSVSANVCAADRHSTDLNDMKNLDEADQNISITEPPVNVANPITDSLTSIVPSVLKNISTRGTVSIKITVHMNLD